MALINPDTTLLIAEQLPLRDLRSLMLTSRAHNALIRKYEHSIAKARISRMFSLPALCPLSTPILSSKGFPRAVLEPATFAVVEELEYRARCADELVQPAVDSAIVVIDFLEPLSRIPVFHGLTAPQRARLIARIKDTLTLVDRIADCEAVVRQADMAKPMYRPVPDHPGLLAHQISCARQDMIRGLSPLDLAFLELLRTLAASAYVKRYPKIVGTRFMEPGGRGFQELVFLQGTVVLHHYFVRLAGRADDETVDRFEAMADVEWGKIVHWESGDGERMLDWMKPLGLVVRHSFPLEKVWDMVCQNSCCFCGRNG
jgi:hypothetical protein